MQSFLIGLSIISAGSCGYEMLLILSPTHDCPYRPNLTGVVPNQWKNFEQKRIYSEPQFRIWVRVSHFYFFAIVSFALFSLKKKFAYMIFFERTPYSPIQIYIQIRTNQVQKFRTRIRISILIAVLIVSRKCFYVPI